MVVRDAERTISAPGRRRSNTVHYRTRDVWLHVGGMGPIVVAGEVSFCAANLEFRVHRLWQNFFSLDGCDESSSPAERACPQE